MKFNLTKLKECCKKFNAFFNKIEINNLVFIFLFSVFNLVIYNSYALGKLYEKTNNFSIVFFAFMFLLFFYSFIFSILFTKWTTKILSIMFIICNVSVFYFMKTFNVLIDNVMLLNVLQTDTKEVLELLNIKMLLFNIFYGVLPSYFIYKIKIKYNKSFIKGSLYKLCSIVVYFLLMLGFLLFDYKNISSAIRKNRDLKYALIPVNYIDSSIKIIDDLKKAKLRKQFIKISEGVKFNKKTSNGKKNLIIFILGEAARSENFSLNSYKIDTNELLKQQDIIFFKNVFSCGTSTAISVPCIFSHKNRKNFKAMEAGNYENLLDFLLKSNSNMLWIENNSGCKGVCDRIEKIDYANGGDGKFCDNKRKECFDEVLTENLDLYIESKMKAENNFIFLHQKGSHGPGYFLRTPNNFKKFAPDCKSEYFNNCSREEIVNSYNNTIYYTSYIINQSIENLKKKEKEYNVALVYISDHGQSLGENNIYLHGMPYSIAPESQKRIPFLLWFSKDFETEFKINKQCLKDKINKELSQDIIFHSMLGLFEPETEYYQKELDIFGDCKVNKQF